MLRKCNGLITESLCSSTWEPEKAPRERGRCWVGGQRVIFVLLLGTWRVPYPSPCGLAHNRYGCAFEIVGEA